VWGRLSIPLQGSAPAYPDSDSTHPFQPIVNQTQAKRALGAPLPAVRLRQQAAAHRAG